MRTLRALEKCAEWLVFCIRIGWPKSDLDRLDALWWEYHDEQGNLKGGA